MATNNQDVDAQTRWKSRYYEALGEIEQREKTWREAEHLLRHLITHLTVAADPRHRALSQNLTELRNAVRDGRDVLRLRELIDRISDQVVELDKMRSNNTAQGHPAMSLLEILDKLQLQGANSRALRQLKKQIAKLNPGEEADEVYVQFVNIVNSVLAVGGEEAPAKSRKQKLLDRILLRQEKARQESEAAGAIKQVADISKTSPQNDVQKFLAPAVGDLLLQLALRMPDVVKSRINFHALKKLTNRARQRKELIAVVDVIAQHVEAAYIQDEPTQVMLNDDSVGAMAQAVHQIIIQMDPPQDLKQRIADLEKLYSEGNNNIESLIHCLNALAELVAEICSRLAYQHNELERFFVQLNMHLEDLDLGIQKTNAIYSESHQDNMRIDKAMHDEIRGIQECMEAASDLTQFKSAIQLRLDTIDQHLLRFHDAEKLRYEQLQKVISQLIEKVPALESDGKHLRSRMEKTQGRGMWDVLTGIPNRQAYEERLASEIARCKRYAAPLSMVVWDVDKFKQINDSYGRAGGDRVLKVVAEVLSNDVRVTDFVARYGGEEFVMLMPETTAQDAIQVADKLRQRIEQKPFYFHDTRVVVTISAGIAQYHQNELVTSLFERADAALDAAKDAGRNQVKTAEDELAHLKFKDVD